MIEQKFEETAETATKREDETAAELTETSAEIAKQTSQPGQVSIATFE